MWIGTSLFSLIVLKAHRCVQENLPECTVLIRHALFGIRWLQQPTSAPAPQWSGRAGRGVAILSQCNETPWAHPSRYSVGVPVLVTFPGCT